MGGGNRPHISKFLESTLLFQCDAIFVLDFEKTDNLCIYQTKINPPHFKVLIGDDVWNLPKVSALLIAGFSLFINYTREK